MNNTQTIEATVNQAAGFVQATWQQAVMGNQTVPGMKPIMHNIGLRRLYADSIVTKDQLRNGTNISQQVIALKKIAEQLENGCGPFDMKPALLNGPKARISKSGNRYNIIPFRHGVSTKHAPDSNFKTMPQDIYKQARALKATVRQGNAMKYGGKLTGTEGKYAPGHNPSSGYQHKAGRYEGMIRIEKTYAKATQNKYMTFRIVSDKSDPGSWIHPGYQPHNIAKAVSDFCRPAVEAMVRSAAIADILPNMNLAMNITVT
jgi:hypothetical protein